MFDSARSVAHPVRFRPTPLPRAATRDEDSPATTRKTKRRPKVGPFDEWRERLQVGQQVHVNVGDGDEEWYQVTISAACSGLKWMVDGEDEYGRPYDMEVKTHHLFPHRSRTAPPPPLRVENAFGALESIDPNTLGVPTLPKGGGQAKRISLTSHQRSRVEQNRLAAQARLAAKQGPSAWPAADSERRLDPRPAVLDAPSWTLGGSGDEESSESSDSGSNSDSDNRGAGAGGTPRTLACGGDEWACSACTFTNAPAALACSVCQTERAPTADKEDGGALASRPAKKRNCRSTSAEAEVEIGAAPPTKKRDCRPTSAQAEPANAPFGRTFLAFVSSSKVSCMWFSAMRHGSAGRAVNFDVVKLEGCADVVLSRRAAGLVRNQMDLLKEVTSKPDSLERKIAALTQQFYPRVFVLAIAGLPGDPNEDFNPISPKKWLEVQDKFARLDGVQMVLVRDATDAARHFGEIIDAEAAAGEGLESTMQKPSPALKNVIQFLRHAPGMSYVTALQLVCHFDGRCLSDIVRCSEADLNSALPWLSPQKKRNLMHYFSRMHNDGSGL